MVFGLLSSATRNLLFPPFPPAVASEDVLKEESVADGLVPSSFLTFQKGPLIIRIGSGGLLYYNHNKEPPRIA